MEPQVADFLKKLKEFGKENDIPNISETNAKFLRDLVFISGAKKVFEIGTANGYSTINLALALRENGGHITSIEFSLDAHNAAKKNVEEAGVSDICTLINANALFYIPEMEENEFDFIFIDGMKRRTKDFFVLSYPKVKKGGFIIVDDVMKFKEKMLDFYEYLEAEKVEYNIIPIDPDDGIMMIMKK